MADEELVFLNGVDAETGEPLIPALSLADLAARIRGETVDQGKLKKRRSRPDPCPGIPWPARRHRALRRKTGWLGGRLPQGRGRSGEEGGDAPL